MELWETLITEIQKKSPDRRIDPEFEPASPGQLRYVRSDAAQWRNGFLYSPPLVLVRESIQTGIVQVMQTYFDKLLAGPGDLILDEAQTGVMELFVETWNMYPIQSDDLGPVAGRISVEVLETAERMKKDPSSVPRWGFLPKPFFRA